MFGHNSPAARARELFKASKDAESLVVSIKNEGKFWIAVIVRDIIIGGRFMNFWIKSSGPGPQQKWQFFVFSFKNN